MGARFWFLAMVLAAGGVFVSAIAESDTDDPWSEEPTEIRFQQARLVPDGDDPLQRGAGIYARTCAACHGRQGRGDGPAASDLRPAPRDFLLGEYRFRSTASGEAPLPDDLARTIRRGLPGTSMPAFGGVLSEREIDELLRYLTWIGPLGSADDAEELVLPAVRPPTDKTLRDGQALYLLLGCWRCHDVNGSGRGPSSATLIDSRGRPVRATDFRHDPFKGGRDPSEVARTLWTGLNGTPMPAYGEALLIARDDEGDIAQIERRLKRGQRSAIDSFIDGSPTRAEIKALGPTARDALRDDRLGALVYHVLSLSKRDGLWSRLFRQNPEHEARQP